MGQPLKKLDTRQDDRYIERQLRKNKEGHYEKQV
jgi:hypothetical protein